MLFNESIFSEELQTHINDFQKELDNMSVGKASAQVIGEVMVDAYGVKNKLSNVGQVIIESAISAKVAVWDKSIIKEVDLALREANLGGSVAIVSDFVRINFNPLTAEDRQAKVAVLGKTLESFKERVRETRRKFIDKVKAAEGVSEDQQKRDINYIEDIIKRRVSTLDEMAGQKEKEIETI